MTRSSPALLALLAAGGVIVAFAGQRMLAAGSFARLVPVPTVSVSLFLIALVLLALAWPVRRSTRGGPGVDPFYATRVLLLAKASALVGATAAGLAVGMLIDALARTVIAPSSVLVLIGALVLAAIALVIAALLAEHWCAVPPEDDDGESSGSAGPTPAAG